MDKRNKNRCKTGELRDDRKNNLDLMLFFFSKIFAHQFRD